MGSPELILGVSDSHDSGAVLICDGQILAAVNEERLDRRKTSAGIPIRTLQELWRVAGVRPQEVRHIAVAGSSSMGAPPVNNDFTDDEGRFSLMQLAAELVDRFPGGRGLLASPALNDAYRLLMRPFSARRVEFIREIAQGLGVDAPITAFDHHHCHVASAYYTSGFPDCLVISNDGFGDAQCSEVAVGRSGQLEVLSRNPFYNSLGVYYNYTTLFCGFPKSHHAGKTTGLAAFGDPRRTVEVFRSLIRWDEVRGLYVNCGGVFSNSIHELNRRLAGVSREDAAAGIQEHCEDILTAMVRYWIARTGMRKIVLVGGVHANVKVNQRIASLPEVEGLFVFPNMGDGGLALGAAFLAWAESDARATPRYLDSVYLGQAYTDSEIEAALRGAGVAFSRPADLVGEVAAHLAANRIVARFDGRMEFGPRALGNRSILYPATNPDVNQWLNRQLRRTEFMPFAPVLRDVDATSFLKGFDERTAHTAEFMTITYDVTDQCKREAPAVVHVDGTARPQVLIRQSNPSYYDILEQYHQRTGLSVLVNTSFNMHEEPIVCTPEDAVKAFFSSGLDVLSIGPFLATNPRRLEQIR
ncbi:MAG: carbamoyltransferase [Candidatus Latescibacteria bacterium]|nr:carbamoyltransferase [Candidatus Latescibacterota bacterium]